MTTVCSELRQNLGGLFECAEVNQYTRIRTPFLYPDGDVIDVFCQEAAGVPTLSDLGETLRWLRQQSLGDRRTARQNKLIADVCLNHGLELYRGTLVARPKVGESLAAAVIRLAQGALRVADLWFTLRTRSVETVSDEVELFLSDKHFQFQRGEQLLGRSGRAWRLDFHVFTPVRSSLLFVLSTGNRASARNVTEHALAGWYDLSNLKTSADLRFISLFDDTMDVWSEEDFHLLDDLSEVVRWSKPDEVADRLAA